MILPNRLIQGDVADGGGGDSGLFRFRVKTRMSARIISPTAATKSNEPQNRLSSTATR